MRRNKEKASERESAEWNEEGEDKIQANPVEHKEKDRIELQGVENRIVKIEVMQVDETDSVCEDRMENMEIARL